MHCFEQLIVFSRRLSVSSCFARLHRTTLICRDSFFSLEEHTEKIGRKDRIKRGLALQHQQPVEDFFPGNCEVLMLLYNLK